MFTLIVEHFFDHILLLIRSGEFCSSAADCAHCDPWVVHVGTMFADPRLARRAARIAARRQRHKIVVRFLVKIRQNIYSQTCVNGHL